MNGGPVPGSPLAEGPWARILQGLTGQTTHPGNFSFRGRRPGEASSVYEPLKQAAGDAHIQKVLDYEEALKRVQGGQGMNTAMGMMALAGPLLQAAGPTKMPVSFAQAAGAGLPQMMQIMQAGPRGFLANEAAMGKLQDAATARRTAAETLKTVKAWQTTLPAGHPARGLPPAAALEIYKEMIKAKTKPEKFTRGVKGTKDGQPGVYRFSTSDAEKKVFVPTPGVKTGSAAERIRERLQRFRPDPTSEEYGQAFSDLYLRPHIARDAGGTSILVPAAPIPRNAILPTLPDNRGQRFSPEAYEAAGYKFHAGVEGKAPWVARTLERKKTLTPTQQMGLEDEVANARQGLEDIDRALVLAQQPAVVGLLAEARGAAEWLSSQFNVSGDIATPVMDFRKAITDIKSVDWKSYVGGGGLSSGDKEWLNNVVPGNSAWDTPKKAKQTLERLRKIGQKKLYRKLIQAGDIDVSRNYTPPAGVTPGDMDDEEYERFTAWRLVFPERFRIWRSRLQRKAN